ncbi:hypothetical protein GS539_19240 [Rhodococcus hoagii]|nr:hypothetical protein [Prescottella equi]
METETPDQGCRDRRIFGFGCTSELAWHLNRADFLREKREEAYDAIVFGHAQRNGSGSTLIGVPRGLMEPLVHVRLATLKVVESVAIAQTLDSAPRDHPWLRDA